jgi:precorrin-2 methylase
VGTKRQLPTTIRSHTPVRSTRTNLSSRIVTRAFWLIKTCLTIPNLVVLLAKSSQASSACDLVLNISTVIPDFAFKTRNLFQEQWQKQNWKQVQGGVQEGFCGFGVVGVTLLYRSFGSILTSISTNTAYLDG